MLSGTGILDACPSLLIRAVTKHWSKPIWEKKGFILLPLPCNSPITEGSWDRSLEAGTEVVIEMLFTGSFSVACWASFYRSYTCLDVAPPTEDWAFPHQSLKASAFKIRRWWHMPLIEALGRQRQVSLEFQARWTTNQHTYLHLTLTRILWPSSVFEIILVPDAVKIHEHTFYVHSKMSNSDWPCNPNSYHKFSNYVLHIWLKCIRPPKRHALIKK